MMRKSAIDNGLKLTIGSIMERTAHKVRGAVGARFGSAMPSVRGSDLSGGFAPTTPFRVSKLRPESGRTSPLSSWTTWSSDGLVNLVHIENSKKFPLQIQKHDGHRFCKR